MDLHEVEAAQRRILRPLREQTGYPVDESDGDAFYDLPSSVITNYIEALEAALVGTFLAAQMLGQHVAAPGETRPPEGAR